MVHLIRFITHLLSVTLVLLALLVVGLRIGLANIDYFETEIKHWLANEVASGISFVDIQGGWNRFNPILRLKDASIVLPGRDQPITVEEMAVELDLVKSVWLQSAVIREISGAIMNLNLKKDTSGEWWLNEFHLGSAVETRSPKVSVVSLLSKFPHYLNIEINQLNLLDQSSGQFHKIDKTKLDLQQHDDAFHFELVTKLPASLGDELVVKANVNLEGGLVYLKTNRLDLAGFSSLFDLDISGLRQAELSGEIWLSLRDEQIAGFKGNLSINEGLVQLESKNLLYTFALSSQIYARQDKGRWSVGNQIDNLKINGKVLRPFNSEIRIATNSRQTIIEGWLNSFELNNLRVLDASILSAKLVDALRVSELQGQLSNVWFNLNPKDIGKLLVAADLSNVASKPVNGIPGFSYLNGSIVIGKKNAALKLSGKQAVFDFADQFRAPFDVKDLKLMANASLVDDDFLVSVPSFEIANSDLRGNGRVWIEANQNDRPFLYIRAKFFDAKGSSTSKYIPLKLMPEKVIDWVDQGVKNADVPEGDLLYHGRLKNIKELIKNRAGELVVDFKVENAEVLFDKKWPVAHDGAGRVVFHNMGVDVTLDKVSLAHLDNGKATISIADFQHAEIEVDVEVGVATAAAVQTWVNTPVGLKYKSIIDGFRKVNGLVDAKLGILLPISDKNRSEEVDIRLNFANSGVKVPAWGLDLSHINGELQITEKTLVAKSIRANFYGDPIDVTIGTDTNGSNTLVQARGNIQSRQLLVLLPKYLKKGIEGKSDWLVEIKVARNQMDNQSPTVQINAGSKLLNTRVLFPAPFGKPVEMSRPANIQIAILNNSQVDFNLTYGNNIKAQGKIEADKRGVYRLYNLDLGFSTPLRNKTTAGIKVYGSISQLSFDDWFEYYHSRIESQGANAFDLLESMDSVDLELRSTFLYGINLINSYLNAKRTGDRFRADLESSVVKGRFDIPLKNSPVMPIVAELDYLRLQSSESKTESSGLRPEDLLNMRLRSKVLSYDNMVFTDLELDTLVEDNELTIEKLAFRNNKVLLSSSAVWQHTPATNRHHSAANVSITGKEFGQTLTALGLGDAMLDGEILLDGQVRWEGGLLQLDWDSLIGEATLQIDTGVIRNVDPGSGRIVGLLSLSALPRRLSLDFKDVLLEGLDFDKIAGTYTIEGGDLYTTNTTMQGSSAKINVTGRTGVLARDYDQKLIITPRIRHTLPVVGAIAAGTAVGLGVLLLQNLFKDVIDKSVQAEYRVTGTWEDPQVQLVKKVVIEKPKIDK